MVQNEVARFLWPTVYYTNLGSLLRTRQPTCE